MHNRRRDLIDITAIILAGLVVIGAMSATSFVMAIILQDMILLVAGAVVAAILMFYFIQWLNHRDDPCPAKRRADDS